MKEALTLLVLIVTTTMAFAQGTAFTYQGRLNDGGNPANGIYDLRFTVYDSTNSPGNIIAGPVTNSATGVTNGLFTVTLDFGNVFDGTARWLEIAVQTNSGNSFTTLAPRQPVTPAPYAIMANTASNLLGNLPTAQLRGNVPASQISGSLPVAQLSGTVPLTQLPAAVVTNNASGVTLNGTFSGTLTATQPGWNPYSQPIISTPIKGLNCFFGAPTNVNETVASNMVYSMVSCGMVSHGYNWFLLDNGGSLGPVGLGGSLGVSDGPWPMITNGVPYPGLTNHTGGWIDFDPQFFPHGAKWFISWCHSNGVKVAVYAFNGATGAAGWRNTAGQQVNDVQPGIYGTTYWLNWLSNAICYWGLDGIKDEVSGGNYQLAIQQQSLIASLTSRLHTPFYVGVATPSGYQPWYRGLFTSWRVGVGLPGGGDADSLGQWYVWCDNTPFNQSMPGSYSDSTDDMWPANWSDTGQGFGLLVKNQLAMGSMANSQLLLGYPSNGYPNSIPKPNLNAGCYYANWDNPLINSIDNDFSNPVTLISSNSLVVAFSKTLADGTVAYCIQNRNVSVTNSFTLGISRVYPDLYPSIATIHDVFLNAPIAVVTNTYTAYIGPSDVAYFEVIPGPEQVFLPGTNSLTFSPWSSWNYPYTGLGIGLNQYGYARVYPPLTNFTTQITFLCQVTNFWSWMINGNASQFTANLISDQNGGLIQFLGDGNVITQYSASASTITPVFVNLAGVKNFSIVMTNSSGQQYQLADPTIVCPTQTKWDTFGRTKTLAY